MKICVLGLGYIGLPTALIFAANGHETVGVDINEAVVDSLRKGKLHISEPGLDELFRRAGDSFTATTCLQDADVFLIAVPTPLVETVKISDLKFLKSAVQSVSLHLKPGNLVILESTVPPGVSEMLVIPILELSGLRAGEFLYAHCPERAIPGRTIVEMVHNDRVIGGYDSESLERTRSLYSSFVQGEIFGTTVSTAEFVKVMENTYRDVNIALANEFAQIAQEYGINVWEAIELANKHPRVQILSPGPGVGGHCIAIDPWFLTENSTRCRMVHVARNINDAMANTVLQLVGRILGGVPHPEITVFGVAYKGNVDDTRESPAIRFIRLAENKGYSVRCYDPFVEKFSYPLFPMDEAVSRSDCIVVITDHHIFREIDPGTLPLRRKNVVDTRNCLPHDIWRQNGFSVIVLGNGSTSGTGIPPAGGEHPV